MWSPVTGGPTHPGAGSQGSAGWRWPVSVCPWRISSWDPIPTIASTLGKLATSTTIPGHPSQQVGAPGDGTAPPHAAACHVCLASMVIIIATVNPSDPGDEHMDPDQTTRSCPEQGNGSRRNLSSRSTHVSVMRSVCAFECCGVGVRGQWLGATTASSSVLERDRGIIGPLIGGAPTPQQRAVRRGCGR